MRKRIALGVLVLVVLAACGSSPPPVREYQVSSTAERTVEVRYTVTDQQAYALAKAWLTLRSYSVNIRTDDSAGGVLAATGDVSGLRVDNEDRQVYPHYFSCRIVIANGVARLNYTATRNRTYRDTSYESAKGYNDYNTNNAADDTVNSFRKAFN